MKTAYYTATDRNYAFSPYLQKLVDKFKFLNGHELNIIDNVPDYNCNCSISMQLPWFKTFLWDIAPISVDRVVYIDRFTIPLLPIEKLPENGLSCVPFQDTAQKILFPNFSSHARFKNCKPLLDFTFFSASRDLKYVFDEMKKKRFAPKEKSEEKGYMNLAIQSGIQVNHLDPIYNWLPLYGNPTENVIHIQHKQGMGMSSKAFFDSWQ